jgi:hypothetical protein
MFANYVIFVKLPKVNTSPRGENSPNLVTLKANSSELEHFFRVSAKQKKETMKERECVYERKNERERKRGERDRKREREREKESDEKAKK